MSTLKIPLQEIRDTAEKINTLVTDNSDIFKRIGILIDYAKGTKEWVGKSVDALKTVTEANAKKYEKTLQELSDLASFLTEYAESMEEEDAAVKKRINS